MVRIFTFAVFLISSLSVSAQEVSKIKSVNFIQDGEVSKLIIDIGGNFIADRKHLKEDKQILLDLKGVVAEKRFLRGIDTSEFSGSSVYISPYRKPGTNDEIRFAVQLRDNVRSFIEKRKNRIILHIENRFGVFTRAKLRKVDQGQLVNDEPIDGKKQKILIPKSNSVEDILENLTQSGVKRYVGRKISLNVNNVPYSEVLKMIGDTSGFNIIIEDEVNNLKPLTINLTNLPWDQVLDTIMDLGKLVAAKYGNILTVTTAEKALAERQKELDEQSKNKTLEPLVTKIFPLSYAVQAAGAAGGAGAAGAGAAAGGAAGGAPAGGAAGGAQGGGLTSIIQSYLTPERGSMQLDARTSNLIVRDTVDVIEKIKKEIEVLDTQTPQVLIEAKIVEAFENYELRAGLTSPGLSFSYDPFTTSGDLADNGGTFTFNSATSLEATQVAQAAVNVGRLANLQFALELMETESKGRIISSPRVITQSGMSATITDSTERRFALPSIAAAGGVVEQTNQTETIAADINLTVTPIVNNEGSIIMNVSVQKSGFGIAETPTELPPTTQRQVQTNVLVDNGSTISIGGIYQTTEETLEAGIPFLKDLPIIGWLFKTGYNPQENKSELLIFITPRVINQEEAGLVNRELGEDLGI